MTIKTITVTKEAYEAMKNLKEEEESFSELFKRISKSHKKKYLTGKDIIGVLKHSPEESEAFVKRVKEIHERVGKGFEERGKYVRTRFQCTD